MFEQNAIFDFEVRPEPMYPLPFGFFECSHSYNMLPEGYVLAQGFPVPKRECGRGLEIPFEIMARQAMVHHPIHYGDGIIFKGSYTALVPMTRPGSGDGCEEEVQWHSVGTKPRMVPTHSGDRTKKIGQNRPSLRFL